MGWPDNCQHGITFKRGVECLYCELAWHEDMLIVARSAVARHEEKIANLRDSLKEIKS